MSIISMSNHFMKQEMFVHKNISPPKKALNDNICLLQVLVSLLWYVNYNIISLYMHEYRQNYDTIVPV